MDRDVEWLDPDRDAPEIAVTRSDTARPELLDVGTGRLGPRRMARLVQRVPRIVRGLALTGVIALVLVYGVVSTASHPQQSLIPAPVAVGGEQAAAAQAMALVEASARSVTPRGDYVRSNSTRGACALVPIGYSPQGMIETAVRKALPEYQVLDVARTLDQFTALCAISVRAADPNGSVLVVDVAAPQQATSRAFTAIIVGARTDADTAVSIATALTRTGWSIIVGTVGPSSDQPSSTDLVRLSQDAALLW